MIVTMPNGERIRVDMTNQYASPGGGLIAVPPFLEVRTSDVLTSPNFVLAATLRQRSAGSITSCLILPLLFYLYAQMLERQLRFLENKPPVSQFTIFWRQFFEERQYRRVDTAYKRLLTARLNDVYDLVERFHAVSVDKIYFSKPEDDMFVFLQVFFEAREVGAAV